MHDRWYDYSNKILEAESDLGPLTKGQRCDLLLDNFPEISDSKAALSVIGLLTHEKLISISVERNNL